MPKLREIYKHYKGDTYGIINPPRDTETGDEIKIWGYAGEDKIWYQCMLSSDEEKIGQVWVRSLREFNETVIFLGEEVPRFSFIRSGEFDE